MKKKYRIKTGVFYAFIFVVSLCVYVGYAWSSDSKIMAAPEESQDSSFNYILERTNDKLVIKDLVIDDTLGGIYKTINIVVPNYLTIELKNAPKTWTLDKQELENDETLYSFLMNGTNSKSDITSFLNTLELTTNDSDTSGQIKIYFKGRVRTTMLSEKDKVDSYLTRADETSLATDWAESNYKPDFYTEDNKYQTHYTFQNQATNVLSNTVSTYLPNVYIVDKTQNNKVVKHIYGAGESSSSFILGIKAGNTYRPFSSVYKGAKIYTKTDEDGNQLIKSQIDKAISVTGLKNQVKYSYIVELEPIGNGTIRHTYRIVNNGVDDLTFIASKNIDTELNGNDAVPVYMYGEKRGVYIMAAPYKLIYDFDVPNGPTQFANAYQGGWRVKTSDTFDTTVYYPWTPKTVVGTGQELANILPDGVVPTLVAKNDTAIDMKWPEVTLKPGESQDFVYEISLTGDYVLKSSYKNLRDKDDVNRPGDSIQLKYLISKASSTSKIEDGVLEIPLSNNLQFDASQGITLQKSTGEVIRTITTIDENVFDPATNTLKIKISANDFSNAGSEISLLFNTTLTKESENKTINLKADSIIKIDDNLASKTNSLTINVANIEKNEHEYPADIPQKVYINAYDVQGNAVPNGTIVLEDAIRIGDEIQFTPKSIASYRYDHLQQTDKTIISPEKFVIGSEKKEAEAIYVLLGTLHVKQEILNENASNVIVPLTGTAKLENTQVLDGDKLSSASFIYTTNEITDRLFEIRETPFFKVTPIIPQFYQFSGYVLTTSNSEHKPEAMISGEPKWDARTNSEIWLTMYLTPTVKDPTMFSQDGNNSELTIKQ